MWGGEGLGEILKEGDKDSEGRRIGGPEGDWTETQSEGNGDLGVDRET